MNSIMRVKDLFLLSEEAARGAKYDTFGSLDCISLDCKSTY